VRRSTTTGLAVLALLLPFVGAAAATGSEDPEPAVLTQLSDYPEPAATGEQIALGVKTFSEANPLRITGTPFQLQAHDQLEAEAASLGLSVETKTYKGVLTALVATKPGTDRADETIIFGAHYDNMVGTIEGAYDNGTGTRAVMELARAFADVPTHRTLEFHFYNGEEEGALASKEIAAEYAASKRDVTAFLGFDMVGIAWPVGGATTLKNCLCMWHGSGRTELAQTLREVNFDFLGFPDDKQQVSIEGPNTRNSDEASWHNQKYPTLRWAGLRRAADYPQYHKPGDTMATIEATAGGAEFFQQGMRNTLRSAYYTAAALDLEGVTPAP
jgi:hypothetical protein